VANKILFKIAELTLNLKTGENEDEMFTNITKIVINKFTPQISEE